MSVFGAIVKTVVNVATLPFTLTADTVQSMNDVADDKDLFNRTQKLLKEMKRDVD